MFKLATALLVLLPVAALAQPTTEEIGSSEVVLARAPSTEVLEPPTQDLTAEPDEEPADEE